MIPRCIKCHRPLKAATETGMGPVCSARYAKPVAPHERDLFGYDTEKAAEAARYRVGVLIDGLAEDARAAVRDGFHAARVRLLGWRARA
jgi:hypothetical protein